MDMLCDLSAAAGLASASQVARVVSERWISRNAYCLACNSPSIDQTRPNTPSTDFICPVCGHAYEVKTFMKRPTNSLVDGAYQSLMSQIERNSAPTLMLLQRDPGWRIERFSAIHSVFLTPHVIEERKPLSPLARRAGWVGCTIRLDRLPKEAEVFVISDGAAREQSEVRQAFQLFSPMSNLGANERGWTSLTLLSIQQMKRTDFSIEDFYRLEPRFAAAYPDNKNVKAKMRQQLQRLRDLGALQFVGRGRYRLLSREPLV